MSFPADSEHHQAAIPPVPQRTVTFVPASKWLMREAHGGAAWPAILAYSGLLAVALLWMGMLTLAYAAVSRRVTAPPGRPAGPAEPPRERVLVGRPQYVTR